MPLIKSISGIRGTIGGKIEEALTPVDIVHIVSAYAQRLREKNNKKPCVAVGRDGRISGAAVHSLVIGALRMAGVDAVDLDLSTTPTVAYFVHTSKDIDGGIIITASHNPREWNALKLLDDKGEFISSEEGEKIYALIAEKRLIFSDVDKLGGCIKNESSISKHVQGILAYPLARVEEIKKKKFKVVADTINSTGAIALPALFSALGVEYVLLNKDINGEFAHNPEPLPEHLSALRKATIEEKADLGIAVDPDVDRLCFVCEDGTIFGEEYTLVAVADYIFQHKKGAAVSNLSSSKALADLCKERHVDYAASKVGEAHVVAKMKEVKAVIGGEGNGGVIVPDFHYGRDALIGIALFLSFMAEKGMTASQIKKRYPSYTMIKDKMTIDDGRDKKVFFQAIKKAYAAYPINEEDGLKISLNDSSWVQIRTSNTEPIVRIFAESDSASNARQYVADMKKHIHQSI